MPKDAIEVKDAMPADALPIANVGRITFYESWSYMYTPEDMKVYTDEEFNPEKIEKDISDKTNTFLLAFVNGKPSGYVKMRRDRNPQKLESNAAIEIERIYVLKEFHNKKVGYALMNRCLEIALSEKLDWIWLGVNEYNVKAVNFYKQFGFEVFGTKEFKLRDVVDIDLMMRKKLSDISNQ